jgi:NAD+ diphosphatase
MKELVIDRAAERRKDRPFLAELQRRPDTRLVPIWRGKCLVAADEPPRAIVPTVAQAASLLDAAEEVVFLGLLGGIGYFMVDLPRDAPPRGLEGTFADLRLAGVSLPPEDFALLGYARGMAHWHRQERYDGRTGKPTRSIEGGFAREVIDEERSPSPGERLFPRTDPAVMVLVSRGDRCLLARQPGFPPGMFSALAGFVEPGESLEACVVREVREEVGLAIVEPRYIASQPWPFPRSLMIGFQAASPEGDIRLDDEELEEARWFSRSELESPRGFFTPPPFSLAHHLIRAFLQGG